MLQLTGVAELVPTTFFFLVILVFFIGLLCDFLYIEWQIERKNFLLSSLLQPNFNNFRHACSQVWVTYSRQHLRCTNIPKHIVVVEVDKNYTIYHFSVVL